MVASSQMSEAFILSRFKHGWSVVSRISAGEYRNSTKKYFSLKVEPFLFLLRLCHFDQCVVKQTQLSKVVLVCFFEFIEFQNGQVYDHVNSLNKP